MTYGGFWIRVVAALIDGLILAVIGAILSFGADDRTTGGLASTLIGWIYYAWLESSTRQATFGKSLLGLTVVDEQGQRISFGRATGRYFAKYLSAIILLIGFIMVAFDARKQGLHDKLAGTLVLKRG
jgi:uncharacterized RDD family membrane protein YckC